MHDNLSVPIEYVRAIGDQLRSMGVDVNDWLQRSGLSASDLDDHDRRFAYPVLRRLALNAISVAREPALGLFVGQRLVASTHGMVGAAAVNSSNVRQALDIVERFARLRTSLIEISHEIDGRDSRVIFTEGLPLGDIQRPLLEAVVLSIRNVLDEITMGECKVEAVVFPFPAPEYAALASDIFRCKVRYGQSWAGFVTAAESLEIAINFADTSAFDEAALICQRELDRLAENVTFAARVQRLLFDKQNGFPSLQVAARMFHMTPRTLHRRLVDEGTSYRELVESVRHTLAVEHLKSGRFSLDEIAYRLGYTDIANFRRAFKRWEKMPPSEFLAATSSATGVRR